MQCFVYKSQKRDDSYLFVSLEDDFSRVPDSLLALLGELELVMRLDLAARQKLASADIHSVKQQLNEVGFYLQMSRHWYKDAT